jgi:hypothetical protein
MFTVVWTNRALNRLADTYVGLDLIGQDRLAAQIDALNHRMHRDPLDEGESRAGDYRITFVDGLTVRFIVDSDGRVVRVYNLRRRG